MADEASTEKILEAIQQVSIKVDHVDGKVDRVDLKVETLGRDHAQLKGTVHQQARQIAAANERADLAHENSERSKEQSQKALVQGSELIQRQGETEKALIQSFKAVTTGTGAMLKATSDQNKVLDATQTTVENIRKRQPIFNAIAFAIVLALAEAFRSYQQIKHLFGK
jgi:hypothetical protein